MSTSTSTSTRSHQMNTPEISQAQADDTNSEDGSHQPKEAVDVSGQGHDGSRPQICSFRDLQLSSDRNQVYPLHQQLQPFQSRKEDLVRKRTAINSELIALRKRLKPIDAQIKEREINMRAEREAAGISEELWHEYEAFCKTLQPNGYRERQSFEWNESYNDSYIKYDPDWEGFDLHQQKNWRCECVTAYTKGGTPIGYQVEYCGLLSKLDETWEERFPQLYDYALRDSRQGSVAALEMLIALPDGESECEKGWLFESRFKESRSSHPDPSQRWGLRASYDFIDPVMNQNKRSRLIETYDLPFDIENESESD
ncbi:hypothetical protein F4678DRAFT_445531 [Xylaria arbuscula]|nr:hypothetical protein F4678DRAFT_445531 [Xylaria arbuscula]